MRNEALCLLDDEQHCAREGQDSSPVNHRLLEIAQMQQQLLQTQGIQLASQQCQTAGQMQVVIDQLHSLAGQPQLAAPARPGLTPEMAHVSIVGNRVISSQNVIRRGPHPHNIIPGVPPVSTASRRATLSAIARRRSV